VKRADSVMSNKEKDDDYFSCVSAKSNLNALATLKDDPTPSRKGSTIAPELEKLRAQKKNDSDCISAFSKAISSVRETKGKLLSEKEKQQSAKDDKSSCCEKKSPF